MHCKGPSPRQFGRFVTPAQPMLSGHNVAEHGVATHGVPLGHVSEHASQEAQHVFSP